MRRCAGIDASAFATRRRGPRRSVRSISVGRRRAWRRARQGGAAWRLSAVLLWGDAGQEEHGRGSTAGTGEYGRDLTAETGEYGR